MLSGHSDFKSLTLRYKSRAVDHARPSLGSRLVEIVGLGIELRCKALDLFARDPLIGTLEAHAENRTTRSCCIEPERTSWSFGTVRQLREIICDREPRRFTYHVTSVLRHVLGWNPVERGASLSEDGKGWFGFLVIAGIASSKRCSLTTKGHT
jgi:hypothetical protein